LETLGKVGEGAGKGGDKKCGQRGRIIAWRTDGFGKMQSTWGKQS